MSNKALVKNKNLKKSIKYVEELKNINRFLSSEVLNKVDTKIITIISIHIIFLYFFDSSIVTTYFRNHLHHTYVLFL